jgi:long-chain fatty acid transport protein
MVIPGSLLTVIVVGGNAHAGGLFLPGSGAVSTARAGAAVSSTEGGEALSNNPAGLAKTEGTTITLSAAIISYSMSFTRRGTYDNLAAEDRPYEGQPFPTVTNQAKPPLGFGSFQPVPVIAVTHNFGKKAKGLTIAAGLYAPNAYPFRDMTNGYPISAEDKFGLVDFDKPPPPTRYDIMKQEAAVILPSIAAAIPITDKLDIGARFSYGFADVKTSVMLWANPANYEENVQADSFLDVTASQFGIPGFGVGTTFRPTPNIELGAAYNSAIGIIAKGEARAATGPGANVSGNPISVRPPPDEFARCARGGTNEVQKVCVEFDLPQSATLGGRYKFLDGNGKLKGDIELQLGWENWSNERTSSYRVVVDAEAAILDASGNETGRLALKESTVNHSFKDTYSVRVGGSWVVPSGQNEIVLRGGIGHDTRAANTGWLRADVDGAARTAITIGGAYRIGKKWELNFGGGFIYEGTNSNPGTCNPTADPGGAGCQGNGMDTPVKDRTGLDPINPVLVSESQLESPVTQGDYSSHYILFMLGASAKF